jgi:hypothetical protein
MKSPIRVQRHAFRALKFGMCLFFKRCFRLPGVLASVLKNYEAYDALGEVNAIFFPPVTVQLDLIHSSYSLFFRANTSKNRINFVCNYVNIYRACFIDLFFIIFCSHQEIKFASDCLLQQHYCVNLTLCYMRLILICVIPLCVIIKIIGTIIAVQHNFRNFFQDVYSVITFYTTCFGISFTPSTGVCLVPFSTGRYSNVVYTEISLKYVLALHVRTLYFRVLYLLME